MVSHWGGRVLPNKDVQRVKVKVYFVLFKQPFHVRWTEQEGQHSHSWLFCCSLETYWRVLGGSCWEATGHRGQTEMTTEDNEGDPAPIISTFKHLSNRTTEWTHVAQCWLSWSNWGNLHVEAVDSAHQLCWLTRYCCSTRNQSSSSLLLPGRHQGNRERPCGMRVNDHMLNMWRFYHLLTRLMSGESSCHGVINDWLTNWGQSRSCWFLWSTWWSAVDGAWKHTSLLPPDLM